MKLLRSCRSALLALALSGLFACSATPEEGTEDELVESSNLKVLYSESGKTWTPEFALVGTKLYAAAADRSQLIEVDAAGARKTLASPGQASIIGPASDGTTVFWGETTAEYQGVILAYVNGQKRILAKTDGAGLRGNYRAQLAEDGGYVYWVSDKAQEPASIFRVATSGGEPEKVGTACSGEPYQRLQCQVVGLAFDRESVFVAESTIEGASRVLRMSKTASAASAAETLVPDGYGRIREHGIVADERATYVATAKGVLQIDKTTKRISTFEPGPATGTPMAMNALTIFFQSAKAYALASKPKAGGNVKTVDPLVGQLFVEQIVVSGGAVFIATHESGGAYEKKGSIARLPMPQ